jgi:hypothetical protein
VGRKFAYLIAKILPKNTHKTVFGEKG